MSMQPARTIKVLVIEDSPTVCEGLMRILHQDPDIQVVSTASDGHQAVTLVQRTKPNVIIMDINMPGMNGFEATRHIMAMQPTSIIMVSGEWHPSGADTALCAAEAGVQAALPRPRSLGRTAFEASAKELVQMVKRMSEVKVVRRWPRLRSAAVPTSVAAPPAPLPRAVADVRAVAIGASTGGPLALRTLFAGLPQAFPAPILLVQHMAPGFVQSFCDWLAQSTLLVVQVARHGDTLLSGHIYIAPDGHHLIVASNGCVRLDQAKPENGARPAVSVLFRAVAQVFGKHAVGILLTGMGKDGAAELKVLRDLGAVTMVQDQESAVVYGMPGEAIKRGAATYVLSPEGMAERLRRVVRDGSGHDMCDGCYNEQA